MAFLKRSSCVHCFLFSMITVLISGCFSGVSAEPDACDAANDEYKIREIKSAFIIKLASYIEWSPQSFSQTSDAFVITILGEDPFHDVIDFFQGKIIKGKKIQIRRISSQKEIGITHILFISASESGRLEDIVTSVRNTQTLTIGDTEGFAKRGVIINFFIDRCYVRFEINPNAVRQVNLKISSKLYRLARIIDENG